MRIRDLTKNLVDYQEPTKKIKLNKREYRVSPESLSKIPDAFIGLSFGSGKEYNQIIAGSMADAWNFYNSEIPIFTQTEIGELFSEQFKRIYKFGETYRKGETRMMISKTDSYTILMQISEKMHELRTPRENVLFFAHPCHIYRVMDQGRIFKINGGGFIPKEILWPENDSMKWVKNKKNWAFREGCGRPALWLLGKIKREF